MIKQELQHFKQHVSKALDIDNPNSCIYTFLPEDIQEAGKRLDSSLRTAWLLSHCSSVSTPHAHMSPPYTPTLSRHEVHALCRA